ncbi:MAG: haloacid dehalogenase-like hydrolase [Gaiellaceae bacterium]
MGDDSVTSSAPPRLVLDWDGTCTEVDSLHMVLERFGDPEVYGRVERELLAGRMSYRELMETEFATVRAPLDEVVAFLLAEARLRAGFHALAAAHTPLILSSGFRLLIEPLLAREGVQLELRANGIEPRADGWVVCWRDEAACAVCGDHCKRSGLPAGDFVFVGDGYSDRCAARAAVRVFARDGLAAYLAEENHPFEPFDDLFDVLRAL